VLTGGEPLLQVDSGLASVLRETGALLHVETNGTVAPRAAMDWTTCSPKTAPSGLAIRVCDELKVVVPAYDPNDYIGAIEAKFLYVQAEDGPAFRENTAKAVAFVQANPSWRLSVQTHKFVNIP
jgi:organic radical activating enzyme